MINTLNFFKPIKLYFPSGWYILKNHLFEIEKEKLLAIKNEDEKWHVKDFFIGPTIFMGRHEHPLNTTTVLVAVLDVGCRVLNEQSFELEYDVNLSISLKKKKSSKLLKLNSLCYSAVEAGNLLSGYTLLFSHQELFNLNTGKLVFDWEDNLNKRIDNVKISNYL